MQFLRSNDNINVSIATRSEIVNSIKQILVFSISMIAAYSNIGRCSIFQYYRLPHMPILAVAVLFNKDGTLFAQAKKSR